MFTTGVEVAVVETADVGEITKEEPEMATKELTSKTATTAPEATGKLRMHSV